ncbi:MAG: hydrogen gas-evolving membrane-bound hydrogenase subunit E [Candidatus Wenzhouxiangella sp. M2_3B_020]
MKHAGIGLLVGLVALAMLAGLLQLPPPGAADSPAQRHVSAEYVAGGAEAAGAANLVTAVLLNYRGLDTFGEVLVIFSALLAVLVVRAGAPRAEPAPRSRPAGLPPSPVVAFVVRLLAPFMAAFAAFVMISGDTIPGGGFQGGVVLGAMMILLAVAIGRDRVGAMAERFAPFLVRAAAPLTFALVAAIGLVVTGAWFGLPESPVPRHALMLALDIAIGVGGAAVLAGIFLALSED